MNPLDQCPACGADLLRHQPETDAEFEWWDFECGADVVRHEDGKLGVNEPCYAALQNAVDDINAAESALLTK
jgi:hypothetical protein